MEIVVAREKHGTFLYASALACLRRRVGDDVYYEESDLAVAQDIIERQGETAAWNFLRARRDHEYEYVSRETVLE